MRPALKAFVMAAWIAAALSHAQAADTDSLIVHYNGPVDVGVETPIQIPAGYVGTVRCSGPAGETCVLVHSERMKNPVSCDAPPFGDPSEIYAIILQPGENNAAAVLKRYSPAMTLVQARAEMRKILVKACEAKYHGNARADFYSVGITDHDFDTKLVSTIAMQYVVMVTARSAKGRAEQSEIDARAHSPPSNSDYMTVTSNIPACPSKADIKALLSAATDKAAWPKAETIGIEDGCIEIQAGDLVYPVGSDMWAALIQVRPKGHARAYWTDMLVVK